MFRFDKKVLTVLFLELLITQGAADTPTEVCTQRQTHSGYVFQFTLKKCDNNTRTLLTCELDSPVCEVCAVRE